MASVCVGCGLDVVGGKLVIKGAAPGDQADLGVVCDTVTGGIDYVVPLLVRRGKTGISHVASTNPFSGLPTATLAMTDYATSYNSAAGIMEVNSDGAIEFLASGVYAISHMGGMHRNPASTHHLRGGRCRLYRSGVILASCGINVFEPTTGFDMSADGGGDGPEYTSSVIVNMSVGHVLEYQTEGVTDVAGVSVTFPNSVNLLTITRIGSTR